MPLLGSGLVGLVNMGHRKFFNKQTAMKRGALYDNGGKCLGSDRRAFISIYQWNIIAE
jgi:hypothetical protein